MIKNFMPPAGEEPYYYASTVENGEIVKHDGDPEYAVYLSCIEEIRSRSNIWHRWLSSVEPDAYNGIGAVKENIFYKYHAVRSGIMDGEITEEELFKKEA